MVQDQVVDLVDLAVVDPEAVTHQVVLNYHTPKLKVLQQVLLKNQAVQSEVDITPEDTGTLTLSMQMVT